MAASPTIAGSRVGVTGPEESHVSSPTPSKRRKPVLARPRFRNPATPATSAGSHRGRQPRRTRHRRARTSNAASHSRTSPNRSFPCRYPFQTDTIAHAGTGTYPPSGFFVHSSMLPPSRRTSPVRRAGARWPAGIGPVRTLGFDTPVRSAVGSGRVFTPPAALFGRSAARTGDVLHPPPVSTLTAILIRFTPPRTRCSAPGPRGSVLSSHGSSRSAIRFTRAWTPARGRAGVRAVRRPSKIVSCVAIPSRDTPPSRPWRAFPLAG